MRFFHPGCDNVEGQRFALSPLGKEVFRDRDPGKLTGIVKPAHRRSGRHAAQTVDAYADQVRPLLEEIQSGRG